MTKRILALLLLSLAVVACQSEESKTSDSQAQDSEALKGEVLARVNGEPITTLMLKQHMEQRAGRRAAQLDDETRRSLLNELVDMTLMAQAAQDEGLADNPEFQTRLESIRRALLAQTLVQNTDFEAQVSEEELEEAYEAEYQADAKKEYKARHILLESEDKAKELISELEGGADFAELAKEHSTGPSGERGGDLGWFSPDQMVPTFADATRQLETGEFSKEPVKTRFGFHVILLEDVRTAQAPAMEDVESELRGKLARSKIDEMISKLREDGSVEYTDNAPKPATESGEGEQSGDGEEMSGEDTQG